MSIAIIEPEMAIVSVTQSVLLVTPGTKITTAKARLSPTATRYRLVLARRTTASPSVWPDDTGRVITRIYLTLDGTTMLLGQGSCSGGIRLDEAGTEVAEYSLSVASYRWIAGVKTSVSALASVAEIHYELELVAGTVTTTVRGEAS